MLEDKRRIQTAVLGDAASEVPLLLEAIEADAFRREHAGDTFWCGRLWRAVDDEAVHRPGLRLRAPPRPGRSAARVRGRARDVSSADHLYLKAAAREWLADRGEYARFTFTQPDGLPVGSPARIRPPRPANLVWADTICARPGTSCRGLSTRYSTVCDLAPTPSVA